jgi:pilus assembly protein CpaB
MGGAPSVGRMASRLATVSDRLSGWPRRIAAAMCAVLAAGSALNARSHAITPVASGPVVVAARDLAAGTVLTEPDIRLEQWPVAIRPSGLAEQLAGVLGRQVAGAVRTGEAVTLTRLVDGAITAGLPAGMVAAPVQLAGTAAAGFVQPGQRVDLLAGAPTANAASAVASDAPASSLARTIAEGVRVLAVTPGSSTAGTDNTRIVVAVDRATALRLAAAAEGTLLVTVRRPP